MSSLRTMIRATGAVGTAGALVLLATPASGGLVDDGSSLPMPVVALSVLGVVAAAAGGLRLVRSNG